MLKVTTFKCQHMTLNTVCGRLIQKGHKFQSSLDYIARPLKTEVTIKRAHVLGISKRFSLYIRNKIKSKLQVLFLIMCVAMCH